MSTTLRDRYQESREGQRREPTKSARRYFRLHPQVAGMAAEDDRIVMNPYSKLSKDERAAVEKNEGARLQMRRMAKRDRPQYPLTRDQRERFADYGSKQDQRETVMGRLHSGDPSAGRPSIDQLLYRARLK